MNKHQFQSHQEMSYRLHRMAGTLHLLVLTGKANEDQKRAYYHLEELADHHSRAVTVTGIDTFLPKDS